MGGDGEFLLAEFLQSTTRMRLFWPRTRGFVQSKASWCEISILTKVCRLWGLISNSISVVHGIPQIQFLHDLRRHPTRFRPGLLRSSRDSVANTDRWNGAGCGLEGSTSGICQVHLVDIPQVIVHINAPSNF